MKIREDLKNKNFAFQKKYIFYIILAVVILFLILLPNMLKASKESESEINVLSAQAETGTIEKTVSGTGTLTEQDAVEVEVPEGVEIVKFLVSNGDFVTEGDALAQVDKTSVLVAAAQVQDSMDTLEEEMSSASSESGATSVTSQAAGRVKAVYAAAGDDVRDVMLEHGALALVSLDGKMAVEFTTDAALKLGDAVTVRLSDGTETAGKVDSYLNGDTVVTLTDNGPALDEEVTVLDSNGSEIGSGTLYIHSEWKATGFAGTVAYAYIKENSSVSAGGTLFTLTDTSYNSEYELLAQEHRVYEDMMDELMQMLQTGTINAPASGCVSGIDETIATGTASSSETASIELLAYTPGASYSSNTIGTIEYAGGTTLLLKGYEAGDMSDYSSSLKSVDITNRIKAAGTDLLVTLDPTVTFYEAGDGDISGWSAATVADAALSAGDTVLVASHTDTDAATGVSSTVCDFVIRISKGQSGSGSGGQGTVPGGSGSSGTSGSMDISSMISGMTGSYSTSAADTEDSLFSTTETLIMDVTPQDTVTVTITVDELDILSLSVGQTAAVTIDALPGQAFEGTVVSINTTSSNNGGNSKYSADVQLDRTLSMLGGMNASVTITVDTAENVLTIPAAAIYDDGSTCYVYTEYNKRKDLLGGRTEVETGSADGSVVQILSGLDEGTTVYYEYYGEVK